MIQDRFIFWQRQHNSGDGLRYIQLYPVDGFPHIGILDPHTGVVSARFPGGPLASHTIVLENGACMHHAQLLGFGAINVSWLIVPGQRMKIFSKEMTQQSFEDQGITIAICLYQPFRHCCPDNHSQNHQSIKKVHM